MHSYQQKKQLENHFTTCKTSFMAVILHYATFPHHYRSHRLSRYSQGVQIHHSFSLFLHRLNSIKHSQHDPPLKLYHAEILSRSYTSSKHSSKHKKPNSFSSEALTHGPYSLSLLLQTAGYWEHIPENLKKKSLTFHHRPLRDLEELFHAISVGLVNFTASLILFTFFSNLTAGI